MSITAIKDCRVFNGVDVVAEGGTVIVEGDRIVEIADRFTPPKHARLVNGSGMTLMPGLIDAHVHVYAYEANLSRNDHTSIVARTFHAQDVMSSALRRGFTALRDAGGADRDLADALDAKMFNGPRLFYSGLALSQTGGHGDFRVPGIRMCGCGYTGAISVIADGAEEVRKASREQLRLGASQIKVMASGGASSPSDPVSMLQYSEAELAAAVEEATRWGTYVMAHAYTPDAISRCVRNGIRSIEHANHIDDAAAALVVEHNAFVVPTLVTYSALIENGGRLGWGVGLMEKVHDVQAAGLRSLEICKQANVRMGFGTDLLGQMHSHQCDEFKIRAEVLQPLEILRSATSINAEILQRSGDLGHIVPGATADLILVRGDPTVDISVFNEKGSNVPFVMIGGEVRKDELDR